MNLIPCGEPAKCDGSGVFTAGRDQPCTSSGSHVCLACKGRGCPQKKRRRVKPAWRTWALEHAPVTITSDQKGRMCLVSEQLELFVVD